MPAKGCGVEGPGGWFVRGFSGLTGPSRSGFAPDIRKDTFILNYQVQNKCTF